MLRCNDPTITDLSDCIGEYESTPYNWTVIAPRQVSNPYYSFDNFGNSLSILFQIVSQEGWTDVMWSAMNAAGIGKQPQAYKSQGNAVFFIVFNLLGAVFVLTLFVSVFMRNYTEQTGVAFLTAEQRSWLELRKMLRQISPSKRPSQKTERKWRLWCYRIAVKKKGKWQRFMTGILFLHLVLLVLEFYPEIEWWEDTRSMVLSDVFCKDSMADIRRNPFRNLHPFLHCQYRDQDCRTHLAALSKKLLGPVFSVLCKRHRCHHVPSVHMAK